MLSLLKFVLLLLFGGVSIILILVGVDIWRTPNHVWEENRRSVSTPKTEFWDRYRKERLYEECERVEWDKKHDER